MKLNLKDICFYTNTATQEHIQELIDIAKEYNEWTYWGSAEHYLTCYHRPSRHVTFWKALSGIDGIAEKYSQCTVVSVEQFIEVYKKYYESLGKQSPKPRFRKKRIPVPKRTVTSVEIHYVDGKTYTLKNISFFQITANYVFIEYKVKVANGISNSTYSSINKALINYLIIKEPNLETTVSRCGRNDSWDMEYSDSTFVYGLTTISKYF